MLLDKIKGKMKSDNGASGSVETILLIALAVFAVMAVMTFILKPIQESSKGIGDTIKKMNPE